MHLWKATEAWLRKSKAKACIITVDNFEVRLQWEANNKSYINSV